MLQLKHVHSRLFLLIERIPVGRNLTISFELNVADCFLSLKVELNQKIVIDVASKEIALMNRNSCWNVFLFCMSGLVDVGVTVLG